MVLEGVHVIVQFLIAHSQYLLQTIYALVDSTHDLLIIVHFNMKLRVLHPNLCVKKDVFMSINSNSSNLIVIAYDPIKSRRVINLAN